MFISLIPISKTILQQTNHPSTEHLTLVQSLFDTVLHAAANAAYLRLKKENQALHDCVDNLQCVYIGLICIYYF